MGMVKNLLCYLLRQRHGEPDSDRYCNELVTTTYCILSGMFNQFTQGIKQITLVLLHTTALNIVHNAAK